MLIRYLKRSVLQNIAKVSALFLLIALTACGYTFQGSGSVLPEDIKTIYIPLAENYTTEVGLADLVTEAVRERFERFGVVQLSEELAGSDAILKLKILSVQRATNTVTSNTSTALSLDSTVTIAAMLQRLNGSLLWKNDQIRVQKSFATSQEAVVANSPGFASGNLNQSDLGNLNAREIARGQEQQVFDILAEQAARQIYNEAVAPEF
jgi:outer membrane lipopolysaccharide assembly protein LptE/RlpB